MRTLFAALLLAALPATAQVAAVTVEKPWARATAPGAQVAGGYMLLRNAGGAGDRLVAASSPAAGRIELHVHINDNGVMKMREVPGYDVPARGSFELKPGGAHLMLMELKRPFKEGDKLPLKLKFEKAGEIATVLEVGGLGSASAPTAGHHKH
jgi:periplasmic copper chaperone A